ncbi:hypothetical protein GCM10027075_10430 [Streptomyces heilongjiangensis]
MGYQRSGNSSVGQIRRTKDDRAARTRNREGRWRVVFRDGRGGEDPRAPTTAVELLRAGVRAGRSRYASPARSRASVPARSEAIRSSSVKPAGASVRVVTPAAA